MRLKSLTYLATRLLETTVYHNSYTDFKKQIMPEHVRGYTHCGSLVPWVAGASADGQEWLGTAGAGAQEPRSKGVFVPSCSCFRLSVYPP